MKIKFIRIFYFPKMTVPYVLCALSLSTFVSSVSISSRSLEDVSGYQYIEDFNDYYAKYSTCFKVKIQENNDDEVEGNSYFYNNKYHAQYNSYAAFNLCEDNRCADGTSGDSIGYVTELKNYLEVNVEFVQEYCNTCNARCDNRRLEDNDDDGIAVNCEECAEQCALVSSSGDDGYDEGNYLECQEAFVDGDIQYYMAPACEDGNIIIGVFYDNECTVSTKKDSGIDFNYETFSTLQSMCAPCDGNDALCADLYKESVHCAGANALENNDDNILCKRYYNNVRVMTYGRRRRKWNFWGPVVTMVMLFLTCGFCTQTYYLRHRNKCSDKTMPLRDNEHGEGETQDQVTTPEISIT